MAELLVIYIWPIIFDKVKGLLHTNELVYRYCNFNIKTTSSMILCTLTDEKTLSFTYMIFPVRSAFGKWFVHSWCCDYTPSWPFSAVCHCHMINWDRKQQQHPFFPFSAVSLAFLPGWDSRMWVDTVIHFISSSCKDAPTGNHSSSSESILRGWRGWDSNKIIQLLTAACHWITEI